ncbi:flagellar motor protein MotD [Thiomonas sp. FB-Cd]|uniref:flagellar motor protein MotD n=1 Tax=Thiomonas sp. FB-Cd TaxID=1158292 RepID=UPI00057171E7|nr:flagellar motor protein MotD [Thiomonas sp. FB-Cd]
MGRKRRQDEHENHERWLVSYADFITLLFAFFVVMYSISSLNEGKYKVLSQTLVSAFAGQPSAPNPIQAGAPYSNAPSVIDLPPLPRPTSIAPMPTRPHAANGPKGGTALGQDPVQLKLQAIALTMAERLASQINKGEVQVRITPLGVVIDIHDNLLFASGQAQLSPVAQGLLQEVAGVLSGLPYQIQVNGYTDDKPIHNPQFQSNWALSAMRAVSVVHMLIEQSVPPGQLIAAGYGQYHPVASNSTTGGRAANRRVSIVIVSPEQPTGAVGVAAAQPLAPAFAPAHSTATRSAS